MDQAQIKQLLQQKQQNPRLKPIPLNLGNKFLVLSKPGTQIQLTNPLTQYPVLLLLFGSDWCNITKPFVKLLKKHYEQINLQNKNVEIIYISLDKSKKDFQTFAATMPWLGISFQDARFRDLKQFYNVRSIPLLILVNNQGDIVSTDCRTDIYNLGEDEAYEKWVKLKKISSENQTQHQIKQGA